MTDEQYGELVGFLARRFDQVDGRLDGIDGRLDGIDGRLDGLDGRLTKVEVRVEANGDGIQVVAEGLTALRTEMLRRFDRVDEEFAAVREEMASGFSAVDRRLSVLEPGPGGRG